MLEAAQRSIITALRTKFSLAQVPTIYLTEVPADFDRPSFYLERILPFRGEDIATHMRQYPLSWQIVYFPPLDASGNEDAANLLSVTMPLEELFGQQKTMILTGMQNGDAVAQIDSFSWDVRDGVGYGSLQISVFLMREDVDAVQLQHVELTMTPKNNER